VAETELPVTSKYCKISSTGIPGGARIRRASAVTTSVSYTPRKESGSTDGWVTWCIDGSFESTELTVYRRAEDGDKEWYNYMKEHADATKDKDDGASVSVEYRYKDETVALAVKYDKLALKEYGPPTEVVDTAGGAWLEESLTFSIGKCFIDEMK